VLVLKKNVHKPGHFQYTIMSGNRFLVLGHKKDVDVYLILHTFFLSFLNMKSRKILVSAILHHIFLLRPLPKSYFKMSTFQPNFLCSSSFNLRLYFSVTVIKYASTH